jgi:hypothetical protein
MQIRKILVGTAAAAGAISTGVYLFKKNATKKERAERLKPKPVMFKAEEKLSPHLTPDHLRFGGQE